MYELIVVFCMWQKNGWDQSQVYCKEKVVATNMGSADNCGTFLRERFVLKNDSAYAYCRIHSGVEK